MEAYCNRVHPSLEYALLFFVAAGISLVTVPLAARAAYLIGAVAVPRARDVHTDQTPRLGGLAIFSGFVAAVLAARALPTLRTAFTQDNSMAATVGGVAILVLLGVLDDRFQLGSLVKLAGQVLAATIAFAFGGLAPGAVYVPGLGVLFLNETQGLVLGVIAAVVIINAVNFIDGLDGLAGGVMMLSALFIFANCYRLAQMNYLDVTATPSILAAALAGALLGFLAHNFPPASIFMGDTGSMMSGLILTLALVGSVARIAPDQLANPHSIVPVYAIGPLLIFAAFAFPLIDMVLAIVRRISRRTSIFAPDKQHLHHWLLNKFDGSMRRTVVFTYGIVAVLCTTMFLVMQ